MKLLTGRRKHGKFLLLNLIGIGKLLMLNLIGIGVAIGIVVSSSYLENFLHNIFHRLLALTAQTDQSLLDYTECVIKW